MPSLFPGMDPYLESPDIWPDFHSRFVNVLSEHIVPLVRPAYAVRIEERVYLEFESDDNGKLIRPDLTISEHVEGQPITADSATATVAPIQVAVVMPDEVREVYLVIRNLELDSVVTVIELLSPSNKRPRTTGRESYLEKRNAVLKSPTHLIEIDLLRGGERMPMREALPAGDYYITVSRQEKRPECDVYICSLRVALPTVPIPLAEGDPDVAIDLQSVFNTVYDRAGYDYTINYTVDPEPRLNPSDAKWARELLRNK